MNCPHLTSERCGLVEDLTGKECPVDNNICLACSQTDRPHRINIVTLNLAKTLTPERDYDPSLLGQGFGSTLASLFKHLSLSEVEECQCPGHQDILDLWTKEYIKKNIDRVVNWLGIESKKRRIPFLPIFTKALLLTLLQMQPSEDHQQDQDNPST